MVRRRPKVFLPAAVVLGMLGVAFGIQPGGGGGVAAKPPPRAAATVAAAATQAAPSTATRAASLAAAQPSPAAQQAAGTNVNLPAGQPAGQPGSPSADVAGVRGTPTATPTTDAAPDFSRESTQCGAMQETAVPLTVEQAVGGVSVRATRAAVYPIEYFRCMLMATGGRESVALAGSIAKAQNGGATHAVLIDLWITNAAREFGQLNLKRANVAAAGQSFAPLATLGGRAEVVVSSGQGRNVTLVVAIKNTVGPHTGPMTLAIEAPIAGGQKTAGKYQLFLPTP